MEICVIEGDGIGHEVIPAALQVLQTVLSDVTIHQAEAGWEYYQENGRSLAPETVELARRCGAVLFGAANSPSYLAPDYSSPIVRLRRELHTFVNLRPTRYLPVPTSRPGVDLVVVRENTEDLYVGEEHTNEGGDTGTATKIITRAATERVAHFAFQLAVAANRERLTIVHKANVMPQTDGLFRRVAFEVSEHYPQIETDELLVDTAAYWMVKDPTRFDVALTPNLYGDILSDMAAAWGGGLGLAPAVNLGEGVGIAEPVHGSAPDIAGKGIANPTAAILSVALLLRHHWKRYDLALQIEDAVRDTFADGQHTIDIFRNESMSTQEFTDAVCERLR